MDIKDLFLSFEKRRKLGEEKKIKIAKKAMEFISPGNEIFLGAGTTVSYLGEELARSEKHFMLKIWTNNLFLVSLWLKKYERFFTDNFVGIAAGEISRRNLSIVNVVVPFSRIDKAIIGTPGISIKGTSSDDLYTVQQIEFLIKKSEKVFILADSLKIGRECTYMTRTMRMIKMDIKKGKDYYLITDEPHNKEKIKMLKRFEKAGFKVIVV
ncbi:DeoR/GlpR transcriptional regulator [bacterium]|nr:DeoR/GlpR transcriptional regulator [bacterium]